MGPTFGLSDLTVLVFEVDGHRYGLGVLDVREIVRAVLPSRLAQAPDIIEGVINVRGQIAAVLDLRTRFGLPRRALRPSDVLLLCEVGQRLLALRADAVTDLLTLPASALASAQRFTESGSYAKGVVPLSSGLLLICDLPAFLSESEQLHLAHALEHAALGSAAT